MNVVGVRLPSNMAAPVTFRAACVVAVHRSSDVADCPVDPTATVAPVTRDTVHELGHLDVLHTGLAERVFAFIRILAPTPATVSIEMISPGHAPTAVSRQFTDVLAAFRAAVRTAAQPVIEIFRLARTAAILVRIVSCRCVGVGVSRWRVTLSKRALLAERVPGRARTTAVAAHRDPSMPPSEPPQRPQ